MGSAAGASGGGAQVPYGDAKGHHMARMRAVGRMVGIALLHSSCCLPPDQLAGSCCQYHCWHGAELSQHRSRRFLGSWTLRGCFPAPPVVHICHPPRQQQHLPAGAQTLQALPSP